MSSESAKGQATDAAMVKNANPEPVRRDQGGLTKEELDLLIGVLPHKAWRLIHSVFTNQGTTFTAPSVRSAADVQEFLGALLNHERFAGEASE